MGVGLADGPKFRVNINFRRIKPRYSRNQASHSVLLVHNTALNCDFSGRQSASLLALLTYEGLLERNLSRWVSEGSRKCTLNFADAVWSTTSTIISSTVLPRLRSVYRSIDEQRATFIRCFNFVWYFPCPSEIMKRAWTTMTIPTMTLELRVRIKQLFDTRLVNRSIATVARNRGSSIMLSIRDSAVERACVRRGACMRKCTHRCTIRDCTHMPTTWWLEPSSNKENGNSWFRGLSRCNAVDRNSIREKIE